MLEDTVLCRLGVVNQGKTMSFRRHQEILPYVFLACSFVVTVFFFWPGILRPDSLAQLQQAKVGVYSDHHPPMMAVIWRSLSIFSEGSGPLFFLHMFFLFGASFFFAASFRHARYKWICVAIPFIPAVYCLVPFILKDLGFSYSYLLAASILTFLTVKPANRKARLGGLISVGFLLVYGTGVKFQAQFILPWMCVWMAKVYSETFAVRAWLLAGSLFVVLFSFVLGFNESFTTSKNHSWQLVKFLDFAGIMEDYPKLEVPEAIKNKPYFTSENVHNTYRQQLRIDELVQGDSPPFQSVSKEEDLIQVQEGWKEAVINHPLAYIKHRLRVMGCMLAKSPLKGLDDVQSHVGHLPGSMKFFLSALEKTGLLKILVFLTTFGVFVPFMVVYFAVGLVKMASSKFALPLVMMNGMALMLIAVLFIFNLSNDARYIYFSVCLFNFSHPLMWKVFKGVKHDL